MFWPVTFIFHQHHINPNPMTDLSAQSAHHEQIFDHEIILVGKDQRPKPRPFCFNCIKYDCFTPYFVTKESGQHMESPAAPLMVSVSLENISLQERPFLLSVAQVCSLPGVYTMVAGVSHTSMFPNASPPQPCSAVPATSSWTPRSKVTHWGHEDHQRHQVFYFSLKLQGANL